MIGYIGKEKLLQDKRVLAEIDRHLWIESEKAGVDIGFEQAKEDWLNRFSKAWMNYNMPNLILKEMKAMGSKVAKDAATKKRRSAKSYYK